MQVIDGTLELQPVGVGCVRKKNEHQPHAKGSRRGPLPGKIKADGAAVSRASRQWVAGVPNAWCAWRCTERKAERQLSARSTV